MERQFRDLSCRTVTKERRLNLLSLLNYSLHSAFAILKAFFMFYFSTRIFHFLISAFEQEFISLSPIRFPKPVFFDPLSLISHFLIHITTHWYFTFCLKICKTQCLCPAEKHIKKESSIHLHLGSQRSTTPLRRPGTR